MFYIQTPTFSVQIARRILLKFQRNPKRKLSRIIFMIKYDANLHI